MINEQDRPKPLWIQPDHMQKAARAPFLCRVEPTKRMGDFVALYPASAIKWWLERAARECERIYSNPSKDYGAGEIECADAIRKLIGEVE